MIESGLNGILAGAYLETNTHIHYPFGNSKLAEFVIRRKQSYQGGYDFSFKLIKTEKFEFLTRVQARCKNIYARTIALVCTGKHSGSTEGSRI
jgi:predicted glycosyltransferase involved in capsule biosynthesis